MSTPIYTRSAQFEPIVNTHIHQNYCAVRLFCSILSEISDLLSSIHHSCTCMKELAKSEYTCSCCIISAGSICNLVGGCTQHEEDGVGDYEEEQEVTRREDSLLRERGHLDRYRCPLCFYLSPTYPLLAISCIFCTRTLLLSPSMVIFFNMI